MIKLIISFKLPNFSEGCFRIYLESFPNQTYLSGKSTYFSVYELFCKGCLLVNFDLFGPDCMTLTENTWKSNWKKKKKEKKV